MGGGSGILSPGNHTLELFFFEGGGEASLELSVRDSSGNYGLLGGGGGGLSGTAIVLTDSGSIDFADVDLSDTHTVSVAANGSGYLGDMTASLADASTGDGAGSVDWDFSVSNDDLAYLAAGESLTQSYTVTVTDNNGASDTEVVTVTLHGTNDDPTASAIVAPATHEDAGMAAIDLLATAEDVDATDDLDVANVSVSSSDGRTVAYTVDTESGAFSLDPGQYNDLAVGESATVTVDYEVTDGNGGVVANTASITVEGRNDAPSVEGPISVGGGGKILFVSDSGVGSDIATVLQGAGHEVDIVLDDFSGGYYSGTNTALSGDLSEYAAIYWSASGNAYGDRHTDSGVFANLTDFVTNGGSVFVTGYDSIASPTDNQLISFLGGTGSRDFGSPNSGTIGANSLKTGVVDIQGVQPSGYYGDVDTLYVDGSAGTQIVVGSSYGGTGASWSLRQLGDGEIAYVSNGQAGTSGSHASWTNTSTGGAGAYNAALLNFAHAATTGGGSISKDDADFSLDLLQGASDPDASDVLNVANLIVTSGNGAGVSQNGNTLDVSPNAYNYLAEGESETIVVSYDILDGNGGSVAQTATFTIAGENDAPTATGDTGSVTEDGTLVATGNLGASDPDANDTLSYSLA